MAKENTHDSNETTCSPKTHPENFEKSFLCRSQLSDVRLQSLVRSPRRDLSQIGFCQLNIATVDAKNLATPVDT